MRAFLDARPEPSLRSPGEGRDGGAARRERRRQAQAKAAERDALGPPLSASGSAGVSEPDAALRSDPVAGLPSTVAFRYCQSVGNSC